MTGGRAGRRLTCVYPWLAMGGADKFNLDMIAQLRARGWRVRVVTTLPHAHPWRPLFAPLCDSIADVGAAEPADQPGLLASAVAEGGPDAVLVSNSALAYAALPALRRALPGAAFADYNHMVDEADPRGGYAGDSLERAAQLDSQLVSSEAVRRWMLARGADPARVHVCTTNIDSDDWDPARYDRAALRAALGIPGDALVALYAARLEPVKRPPLAAAIMRDVALRVPGARFLVAGDGTYAGFMRSALRRRGLAGRAQVLGAVSNARVRELLALSDVLLLPSRLEGLSLAIFEAMAMGVVPVSVDVGGQAELVTPECGVLVPRGPGERRAYVEALAGLAEDRGRLRAMGAAARRRVREGYRLDQMGDRADALLRAAIDRAAASPRPPESEAVSQAALRAAAAVAARDAAWARPGRPATLRRRARDLYWWLVGRGAWWLVPAVERARGHND